MRQYQKLLRTEAGRSGPRSGRFNLLPWPAGFAAFVRIFLFGIVLTVWAMPAKAEDEAVLDFQVKAAFLVNFPKYIDWPSTAVPQTNSKITVGIFGDDNVAEAFAAMVVGGKTIYGHPIVLKRIIREEEISSSHCQILFIAASERSRAPAILESIKNTAILSVGETDDFLEKGGMINLTHRGRNIRFEVNLDATRPANLKISSKLLVAADTVKGRTK
jgi:hypothetical protein